MRKLFIPFVGALFALIFVACSKPESEAVTEPQAPEAVPPAAESLRAPDSGQAGGSDPTVVDSDHYQTEFENEAVRILRITYGPGEESVMHYHPDSVAVFVTDHLVQMQRDSSRCGRCLVHSGWPAFAQEYFRFSVGAGFSRT
jgi:hypothetical protein